MSRAYPKSASLNETLSLFEVDVAALLRRLREAATAIYRRTRQPVSTNDVRSVLAEAGYTGDPRVLGAVFLKRDWIALDFTKTTSPAAHPRLIRTFVPRDLAQRYVEHGGFLP